MLVGFCLAYVVAHDIDEVNVGKDCREVVEAGVAGGGERQELVGTDG